MKTLLAFTTLLLSSVLGFTATFPNQFTTNLVMNPLIDGLPAIWNDTAKKWSNAPVQAVGTNVPAYVLTNSETKNVTLFGWLDQQGLQTNRLDLRVSGGSANLISDNNIFAANNLTSKTFNVGTSLHLGALTNRGTIGFVMEATGNGGYYAAGASGVAGGYMAMSYSGGGFLSSDGVFDFRNPSAVTMVELSTNTSLFSSNLQVNGNLIANLNLNLPQQAPSRVAIINGSGNVVSDANITTTELSYLDGLTSPLLNLLGGKVDNNFGSATNLTVKSDFTINNDVFFNNVNLTASSVLALDSSKMLITANTVNTTELGYLDGVTSALQPQLNGKVDELNGVATNVALRGVSLPAITQSRALVVDGNGNLTNVTSGSPSTEFVKADGTAAVPAGGSGTPGGETPMIQMNMGGAFVGTTNLIYDPTNKTMGLNLPAGERPGFDIDIGGQAPKIQIRGTSPNNTNTLTHTGMVFRTFAGANAPGIYNNEGAFTASYFFGTNAFYYAPTAQPASDLGRTNAPWRTAYISQMAGASALLPTPSTQQGTNTALDGSLGTLFTNAFNSVSSGLTNIVVTNINDGQTIRSWIFASNGVTVAFPQFTAAQYLDGAVVPVATNQWTEVQITRRGTETNINVKSATFALVAGTGITLSTNFVTKELTLNNTANGVYRTIYIDAAAMVSNLTAGATFFTDQTATPTNRMVDSYVFDGAASNIVQFKLAMPLEWDLGACKVKLWTWTTNNLAAMTNVYGISAAAIKNGSVVTNIDWGTEQTITNVVSSAAGAAQLTDATLALTIGNTPAAAGNLTWWRIRRIPQNSNDNDLGQSKVLGAWVQYKQGATEPASW
jgi:hypothetical protein